ncbi:hypothetical protein [Silvibacterium acidisoli]|uniref:hypothetical protein n=1 Tax=Acidobacteriaceae bacterium ZG23-2 TaxID=2883246 RepID=UPI00406C0849
MNSLVKKVIEAHGGLEPWSSVDKISATFRASGSGFKQRGPLGEALTQAPMQVHIATKVKEVTFKPFLSEDQVGIYRIDRTWIESKGGTLVESLDHPREVLEQLPQGAPWTGPQLIYFLGYSLWMYHTLPYSFLEPGIVCENAEPWSEGGETWQGLKVTYPDSYPAHSKEQIHYFDSEGIMRRQDYTVDVRQNLKIAHYMLDHQVVDGFVFARKRRICLRGEEGQPLWERTLIAADLENFAISRVRR